MFKNITHIDLEIMSIFIPDYSSHYTLREITQKKNLNYSNAHNRFKFLIQNNYIKSIKVGNSHIIALNLNPKTIQLISYVESLFRFENVLFDDLIKRFTYIDSFVCIGLFGSRADNQNKSDSDWDIFILTKKRKDIEKELKNIIYDKFHFIVFEDDEFIDSLATNEETVIKHIINNKRIIYNPYPFYNLIYRWELMKSLPKRV
jgi:predicted nucleotidyltransferase